MAADGEAQARAMLSAGAPKMQQSVVPPSPVRPVFVTPAREEDGLIQALQARLGEQKGGHPVTGAAGQRWMRGRGKGDRFRAAFAPSGQTWRRSGNGAQQKVRE
jgi:hypothetical protein